MFNDVKVFYGKLESVLNKVTTSEIKQTIGDSLNNHRVPTVMQVIRFLDATGKSGLAASLDLYYIHDTVQNTLHYQREVRNYRRDSFDINEFKTAIRTLL